MSYAIVGILVVAFIAFVIMSAKAWHWSNIVFLCLCFLTGLGGLIAMAQVLDSRRDQMLDLKKVNEQLERVESDIETVVYGSGFSDEYDPESLRGLSEALSLELAGQGRVWYSGAVEATGENRIFKFAGNRIQAEENPAQMDDMLLFVFADQQFGEGEIYPVVYVGSMRVVSETPDSVELEPVDIVDNNEYQSPTSSWTLFEKAPVDQRDAYLRNTDIELDDKSPNLNKDLDSYRTVLTQQFLPAELFGFDLSDDAEAQAYELMVDRIMFDGLPLVKIESWIESQSDRVSRRFDPANEEVFVRYRFDSDSSRPYQVDSTGNIESDGQFTANGQAVNPALHAGGEITFKKGDEILIDQLSADGYQRGDEVVPSFASTEPVTEVERVYVRQLSDFPFLLRTYNRRFLEYSEEIERIKANNRRSQQAINDTQQQSNERDNMIELLLADGEKFEQDLSTINSYADDTKTRKGEIESQLKNLNDEIQERHKKIKKLSRRIDSMNRKKAHVNSGSDESLLPSP